MAASPKEVPWCPPKLRRPQTQTTRWLSPSGRQGGLLATLPAEVPSCAVVCLELPTQLEALLRPPKAPTTTPKAPTTTPKSPTTTTPKARWLQVAPWSFFPPVFQSSSGFQNGSWHVFGLTWQIIPPPPPPPAKNDSRPSALRLSGD